MRFRSRALVATVVLTLSVFAPARTWGADRPNILWLIAEDFGNQLGCTGTKEVSTPNLDRLAGEGVRYSRFYTTAPVCSPSRSAFMTGMYQTTIGRTTIGRIATMATGCQQASDC